MLIGKTDLRTAPRDLAFFLTLVLPLLLAVQLLAAEAHAANQEDARPSSHRWQVGIFLQGCFPATQASDFTSSQTLDLQLSIYSGGFEAGRQSRRFDGPGPMHGRGEALLEIMPLWLAHYPSQTVRVQGVLPFPLRASSFHGASVTPWLLRWNFSRRDSARFVPWAQLGGGLLWTNHKFPIYINSFGPKSGGSVINFTPQVGAGVNIFNRPRHSINFAMKAVHVSNAGLGDHNPGLNVTLQFSAGYSWWK